jgi:hypothetical protein
MKVFVGILVELTNHCCLTKDLQPPPAGAIIEPPRLKSSVRPNRKAESW